MDKEKDVQSTDLSPKNLDFISYFSNDSDFVFVYKKTEKLATAIYMVTALLSENEPIKWTLRKNASELLSFIINYKDINSTNQIEFVYKTKSRVLELTSLLEVSKGSGLISDMNFSILHQEFLNLIAKLDNPETSYRESINQTLSESFFSVPKSNIHYVNQVTTSDNIIKDNFNLKDKSVFKRSNRQNIILGLLKKKKELTIKDISEVIKDCSEKTIQRELISFIEAGILKKTGERRWSKYSIA